MSWLLSASLATRGAQSPACARPFLADGFPPSPDRPLGSPLALPQNLRFEFLNTGLCGNLTGLSSQHSMGFLSSPPLPLSEEG